LAIHHDASAVGAGDAEEALQKRGFASTVGADKTKELSLGDLERYPTQDFLPAVSLAHTLDANHEADCRLQDSRLLGLVGSSARSLALSGAIGDRLHPNLIIHYVDLDEVAILQSACEQELAQWVE